MRRTTRAYLLLQAQTMSVGTEFIFYMVELARFLVGLLAIQKIKKEVSQILSERETRYLQYFGGKPFENGFHEFNLFLLQMDRLQLTAVYCNRREL